MCIRDSRGPIPAPVENLELSPQIAAHVQGMLQGSAVGTPEQVAQRLSIFQSKLQPDEYILSMPFYHHEARLKSMELTIGIRDKVEGQATAA